MNRNKLTGRRLLKVVADAAPSPVPDGPSPAELDAIEAEWPLIAAEIAVVDAECAAARNLVASELDRRRLRRARERVVRELAAVAARDAAAPTLRAVA